MFLFYIFVSPLFRFGPNFRVQNEDIAFGLSQFPTVEKVFCSGVHRAPKSRIDSRVNGKIVQTVAQLATEMWNISCATLIAWLREILPRCYFREPSWQLQEKCQGLSLWVKGRIRHKNTKKTNDMQNKI
jgi:hypothetical protein